MMDGEDQKQQLQTDHDLMVKPTDAIQNKTGESTAAATSSYLTTWLNLATGPKGDNAYSWLSNMSADEQIWLDEA